MFIIGVGGGEVVVELDLAGEGERVGEKEVGRGEKGKGDRERMNA